MKVDFQTAHAAPVKSNFAYLNAPSTVSTPYFSKLQNSPDVFDKSSVSFGKLLFDDRQNVIEAAQFGLVRTLAGFARTTAQANYHSMPHKQDLDICMDKYFPLCVISSKPYAVEDNNGKKTILYPSEKEFVEVIKTLWDESKKDEDVDMTPYLNPRLCAKAESVRLPMMQRYIREDFGRALNNFSISRYKHPAQNEEQVEQLAKELYNDSSFRPLKKEVSEEFARNGDKSKYRDILEKCHDSREISELLDSDMKQEAKWSLLFDTPRSLRSRYEKQVDEFRELWAREDARNGDPYGDTRSDWEILFDDYGQY